MVAIATAHLRRTLYHELHHFARRIGTEAMPGRSVMDGVIHEGMASVFARDYAGAEYPWVQYPDDVSDWMKELLALPDTAHGGDWMFRHPDGRWWIGYRAGAYLVDQPIKTSGLSAAELVSIPPDDVVRMALATDGGRQVWSTFGLAPAKAACVGAQARSMTGGQIGVPAATVERAECG